jgi:hypothetical protein
VDGLEREMAGRLEVIRLDLDTPAGRELGRRWSLRFTPSFILFDAAGREAWRGTGRLDPAEVRRAVGGP